MQKVDLQLLLAQVKDRNVASITIFSSLLTGVLLTPSCFVAVMQTELFAEKSWKLSFWQIKQMQSEVWLNESPTEKKSPEAAIDQTPIAT